MTCAVYDDYQVNFNEDYQVNLNIVNRMYLNNLLIHVGDDVARVFEEYHNNRDVVRGALPLGLCDQTLSHCLQVICTTKKKW